MTDTTSTPTITVTVPMGCHKLRLQTLRAFCASKDRDEPGLHIPFVNATRSHVIATDGACLVAAEADRVMAGASYATEWGKRPAASGLLAQLLSEPPHRWRPATWPVASEQAVRQASVLTEDVHVGTWGARYRTLYVSALLALPGAQLLERSSGGTPHHVLMLRWDLGVGCLAPYFPAGEPWQGPLRAQL